MTKEQTLSISRIGYLQPQPHCPCTIAEIVNGKCSTCRYPKMAALNIALCHSQKINKFNATRHPADFKSTIFIVRICIMSLPHFPLYSWQLQVSMKSNQHNSSMHFFYQTYAHISSQNIIQQYKTILVAYP
jgi:hypothetical protein